MRVLRLKSDDASLEIERDEKLCDKVEFTREMGKSLTTLDFIGLVVLTTFLPVLFHVLQTGDDNPQERVDK